MVRSFVTLQAIIKSFQQRIVLVDPFDRQILNAVQRDNQQTHQQIADAVNSSPTAVARRL